MSKFKITGKNPIFTTGSDSPITINKYKDKKEDDLNEKKTFFENWIFKSALIAIVLGGTFTVVTNSYKIGLIISALAFCYVFFLNPKRRFFRIALTFLFLGITMIPKISGYITFPPEFYIQGKISVGGTENYIIATLLIIISVYLFYLDYKVK